MVKIMCGILGAISTKPLKVYNDEMKKLWIESQSRGKDSMGFYAFNLDNTPICVVKDDKTNAETNLFSQLFKEVTHPEKFFGSQLGRIDLSRVQVMLGHTRAATQGDCSLHKNNHPFETKDFVWAHNGIINNDTSLAKEYKLNIDSECDSAVIGHLIQHFYDNGKHTDENLIAAITKAASELKGGFSVWVVYKPTGRIFFFRNTNNPFEYTHLKDGTFVFCSSAYFIKNAFPQVKSTSSSAQDRVYELKKNENSFTMEVVAELPKASSMYTGQNKTGTSGLPGKGIPVPVNNISRSQDTNKKVHGATEDAPPALVERAISIGEVFELDGYFCRKKDKMWVLATGDEKLIKSLLSTSFGKNVKEIENQTKKVIMLTVHENEMSRLLDEVENYFRASNSSGAQFISYFNGLKGIHVEEGWGSRITFRVTDPTSEAVLNRIGISINGSKAFTVKGRTAAKVQNTLEVIEKKLKIVMSSP